MIKKATQKNVPEGKEGHFSRLIRRLKGSAEVIPQDQQDVETDAPIPSGTTEEASTPSPEEIELIKKQKKRDKKERQRQGKKDRKNKKGGIETALTEESNESKLGTQSSKPDDASLETSGSSIDSTNAVELVAESPEPRNDESSQPSATVDDTVADVAVADDAVVDGVVDDVVAEFHDLTIFNPEVEVQTDVNALWDLPEVKDPPSRGRSSPVGSSSNAVSRSRLSPVRSSNHAASRGRLGSIGSPGDFANSGTQIRSVNIMEGVEPDPFHPDLQQTEATRKATISDLGSIPEGIVAELPALPSNDIAGAPFIIQAHHHIPNTVTAKDRRSESFLEAIQEINEFEISDIDGFEPYCPGQLVRDPDLRSVPAFNDKSWCLPRDWSGDLPIVQLVKWGQSSKDGKLRALTRQEEKGQATTAVQAAAYMGIHPSGCIFLVRGSAHPFSQSNVDSAGPRGDQELDGWHLTISFQTPEMRSKNQYDTLHAYVDIKNSQKFLYATRGRVRRIKPSDIWNTSLRRTELISPGWEPKYAFIIETQIEASRKIEAQKRHGLYEVPPVVICKGTEEVAEYQLRSMFSR